MAPGGFRPLRWLGATVFVLAMGFAAYTWFVLTWSFSTGERAGYVQKLSRKGWLCKTWEGEMALVSMPGTVAEKFAFTVRSDEVARRINDSIGARVALTYEQHIGIPTTCFGETQYFVTAVKAVQEPGFLSGGGKGQ
ncbi:MAG TPA: hypothetical protein VN317_03555 [Candidatus Methanoperedens sp.]|nr:hypothetical protein [Candidatus Methanoperedens sp.]